MRTFKFFPLSAVSALFCAALAAQSFNVDFGVGRGRPSDSFSGGARHDGHWNLVERTGRAAALLTRQGGASAVTVAVAFDGIGAAGRSANHPATIGDAEALLDDFFDLGFPKAPGSATIRFQGLRPAGYTVFTYAWAPDSPGFRTRVTAAGQSADIGGDWPGAPLRWANFARHEVEVGESGTLEVNVESRVGRGRLNGLQLVMKLPADDPEFRSVDGFGNNLANPDWGRADTPLLRVSTVDYSDGVSEPSGEGRPSPRDISNAVVDQRQSIPEPSGASDMLWQWGQFLDHDIDLTDPADPAEPFPIPVPQGDMWFDPFGTGQALIPLFRSAWDEASGTNPSNPRQQMNAISAFIDASNVYGSGPSRARALRSNDGTGRLRVSAGNLLPFNHRRQPNAGGNSSALFLAGDVRANEQVALTAMHTLFVREHNRLAARAAAADPSLSGEQIYQRARSLVAAQIQVITYREFLPALLGPGALSPYQGYDPEVDASIMNAFSTAAFRLGHSMLPPQLMRLDDSLSPIPQGHLALRDAFFAPFRILSEGGIEPLLRGLATQVMQRVDVQVVDEVRNFLFGPPGAGGFDLASLNIQRGRDHGLPSYNQLRVDFGLPPARSFADVTSDPVVQASLAGVYSGPEEIDAWLGGLAEDRLPGALVGELIFTILKDQFERLRDGDRFWYQRAFSGRRLEELEQTRLSDIIRRNTSIGGEIQDDVFAAPPQPRPERVRYAHWR